MAFNLSKLDLPVHPITPSPDLQGDLGLIYSALNTISLNLDKIAGVKTVTFTEAISYGQPVNLYDSSGVKARKANATDNTKVCHGICLATDLIVVAYTIVALSGLTPGAIYYLSTTSGVLTTTRPAAAGNIVQAVGVALSDTELYFTPTLLFTQL